MDNPKKHKKVLITGCSSGFGLLTAVGAAKAGHDCIATMRNLDKAGPLTSALSRAKTTATIDRLDVTDPQMIRQIAEKYAPIDILINNAGILIMGSFLDLTEDEVKKIFDTNYFGVVNLTKAVIPQMIEHKQGMIINVASLAGLVGHMFNSAYAATKHALIGFSRSIRLELKSFNIKVVSVEPGYHKTKIIGANANLSENFYNRQSPMFEQNQGFLRLMFDEIIPRAGQATEVAEKIVQIMAMNKPKPHYVIGKDAKYATTAIKLGLGSLLEKKVSQKLEIATKRQEKRAERKRKGRKKRNV